MKEIEVETEALLAANSVDASPFSDDIIDSLPVDLKITNDILKGTRHLTSKAVVISARPASLPLTLRQLAIWMMPCTARLFRTEISKSGSISPM